MPTRRLVFCLSLVLSLCLSGLPATAQDAPPHEGEGVQRHAKPKAPAPVQKAQAAAPQKASGVKAPAAPAAPAADKKPAPARAAKGPAVKNDGKPYLRSLDKNHDGRVSREEFVAGSRKRFAQADANRDGVVSPQEAKAAKAKAQEKQAKADARRAAQGKQVKAKGKGGKASKPYLSTLDKNRDGRVTEKEYLARRDKKFAEMDLNHDGVVSREEARIAKQKLLERRAEKKAQAKANRLRKIEEARAKAQGTVSSSGPELLAPASPPPPPAAVPLASPPTQSVPGHPEAPLTPLTPDLPAQGAPAT